MTELQVENAPLRCFFIDDTKELSVPSVLRDSACDWTVFRSLHELRNSEVFLSAPADVVVFDYYLNERGTQTGKHAIHLLASEYHDKGWALPRATFISSDPSCNDAMQAVWLAYDGPLLMPPKPVIATAGAERKKTGVAQFFRRNKVKKPGR